MVIIFKTADSWLGVEGGEVGVRLGWCSFQEICTFPLINHNPSISPFEPKHFRKLNVYR